MRDLSNLIARISRTLDKDKHIKSAVISAIDEIAGVRLGEKEVSLNNGVLELSAGSAAKSAIKLKEEKILTDLSRKEIGIFRVLYK